MGAQLQGANANPTSLIVEGICILEVWLLFARRQPNRHCRKDFASHKLIGMMPYNQPNTPIVCVALHASVSFGHHACMWDPADQAMFPIASDVRSLLF